MSSEKTCLIQCETRQYECVLFLLGFCDAATEGMIIHWEAVAKVDDPSMIIPFRRFSHIIWLYKTQIQSTNL
jgi:hypothetical protein